MARTTPYTLTINEVFDQFNSQQEGLSDNDVKERRKEYGPNKLTSKKQKSVFQLFIDQVNNPVIYLLLVIVVVSLFFKDFKEV